MPHCFKDITGFNDRWVMVIGIPLAGVLMSLLMFQESFINGDMGVLIRCMPLAIFHSAVYWIALRWTYYRVKIKYPSFRDVGKRLFWMLLAFVAVFFFNGLLYYFMEANGVPARQSAPKPIMEFIASGLVSALVITIYEVLSFYIQLERTVREKADLERQNVESQLEGLRNQVNPHFLFNSLNTLVYLIPEAPQKAVGFVQQLSKVYRYVLESREARIIPLSEEMEFLKSYVFLLKERFGENLQVQIADLNGATHKAIVPLSLQMLFENAIKHNVISTEKPLLIEVFVENENLVVRNKLQRKNQVMHSTGVGIDNIRARYRMLFNREPEVIVSQEYFTVLLPLVDFEMNAQ